MKPARTGVPVALPGRKRLNAGSAAPVEPADI